MIIFRLRLVQIDYTNGKTYVVKHVTYYDDFDVNPRELLMVDHKDNRFAQILFNHEHKSYKFATIHWDWLKQVGITGFFFLTC